MSKLDEKPIYNESKSHEGPNYFKPDLSKFLSRKIYFLWNQIIDQILMVKSIGSNCRSSFSFEMLIFGEKILMGDLLV